MAGRTWVTEGIPRRLDAFSARPFSMKGRSRWTSAPCSTSWPTTSPAIGDQVSARVERATVLAAQAVADW